jgi:D-tyrosyl-tRNA(Tyr) deacylase
MRVLLQRVTEAHVTVAGATVGNIGPGLLVLLGVEQSDTPHDAAYLANKVVDMRIFNDENGKMNRNIAEAGGSILVISQFTLYGDCRKGRRPSFDRAAAPELARELYEHFIQLIRSRKVSVETGVFQASMLVHLVNDGPVTILCDSVRITAEE